MSEIDRVMQIYREALEAIAERERPDSAKIAREALDEAGE